MNVDRCQVNDEALPLLVDFPDLRMLYTHDCPMTRDKQKELTAQRPKLAIFGDFDLGD